MGRTQKRLLKHFLLRWKQNSYCWIVYLEKLDFVDQVKLLLVCKVSFILKCHFDKFSKWHFFIMVINFLIKSKLISLFKLLITKKKYFNLVTWNILDMNYTILTQKNLTSITIIFSKNIVRFSISEITKCLVIK
jgi:hypothetical protein